MSRVRLTQRLEAAFTAIELLITAGVMVLVLAAVVVGFSSVSHTARAAAFNEAGKAAAQAVVDGLSRDCASAIACFTPSNDVGNHSNADGHEVAFYTRDAHGVGKFWSYCYKAKGTSNCAGSPAAGTVTLYGPYAWSALPQNGGTGVTTIGAVASNITGFAASTITASQLLNTTTNPLTAGIFVQAGYTSIVNVQRQTGYPGVLAGNNVTIVRLATQGLTREVHLLAGVRPTHVTTVVGQITPPPNAITAIGSGTNYAWTNPLGAAVMFGVAENNYGTRTTTPAQIYSSSSNTCTSGLQGTAGSTLTPVSDGTGDATFTLAPQVKVEPSGVTCQIVYVDNMGQAATFQFTVGATHAPTSGAGAGSYYNTQTLTFTVSEQNYEPPGSGGGFTAGTSGACGAPSLASDSFSSGTYTAVYNVAGSGHGGCTLTATDAYGQQTSASTQVIAQQAVCSTDPSAGTTAGDIQYVGTNAEPPCAAPTYAISVSQNNFTNVVPGTWAYWNAVANITNANASPGSPPTSPVTITNGTGACYWSNPGWLTAGGTFGGAPSTYGISCTAQVVDQNNDTPVTVAIAAEAGCPPPDTGTPPNCISPPTAPPAACVVSGSAPNFVFSMPATGGTCTISGTATLTGTSQVCNPITISCRASTIYQTGTDTQGVGAFGLSYVGSSDSYSGWYCYSSGALAGEAGCQGVVVQFATLPNASLPLTVNYAFSNWSHSGTCTSIGVDAYVFTAETEAEVKATAQSGTNQTQPYYTSYQAALYSQGYESPYNGIDPTASSFFVTWLPEASQLGVTCTANESFDYTVTVTQAAGAGGVHVSAPTGMAIQE